MCLVALANDDSVNLYPPDIAPVRGAEVALVPSSAGMTLSGLPVLPIMPSLPITWRISRGDETLETLRGDSLRLSRFLKPRTQGMFPFQGMTLAEKDTLVAFLKANVYWSCQLPGDVARAYASLSTTFPQRGLGANAWSMSVDVVQLEVAP